VVEIEKSRQRRAASACRASAAPRFPTELAEVFRDAVLGRSGAGTDPAKPFRHPRVVGRTPSRAEGRNLASRPQRIGNAARSRSKTSRDEGGCWKRRAIAERKILFTGACLRIGCRSRLGEQGRVVWCRQARHAGLTVVDDWSGSASAPRQRHVLLDNSVAVENVISCAQAGEQASIQPVSQLIQGRSTPALRSPVDDASACAHPVRPWADSGWKRQRRSYIIRDIAT